MPFEWPDASVELTCSTLCELALWTVPYQDKLTCVSGNLKGNTLQGEHVFLLRICLIHEANGNNSSLFISPCSCRWCCSGVGFSIEWHKKWDFRTACMKTLKKKKPLDSGCLIKKQEKKNWSYDIMCWCTFRVVYCYYPVNWPSALSIKVITRCFRGMETSLFHFPRDVKAQNNLFQWLRVKTAFTHNDSCRFASIISPHNDYMLHFWDYLPSAKIPSENMLGETKENIINW